MHSIAASRPESPQFFASSTELMFIGISISLLIDRINLPKLRVGQFSVLPVLSILAIFFFLPEKTLYSYLLVAFGIAYLSDTKVERQIVLTAALCLPFGLLEGLKADYEYRSFFLLIPWVALIILNSKKSNDFLSAATTLSLASIGTLFYVEANLLLLVAIVFLSFVSSLRIRNFNPFFVLAIGSACYYFGLESMETLGLSSFVLMGPLGVLVTGVYFSLYLGSSPFSYLNLVTILIMWIISLDRTKFSEKNLASLAGSFGLFFIYRPDFYSMDLVVLAPSLLFITLLIAVLLLRQKISIKKVSTWYSGTLNQDEKIGFEWTESAVVPLPSETHRLFQLKSLENFLFLVSVGALGLWFFLN